MREPISRRALVRRSIGAGLLMWLTELAGGTISFLWSASTLAGSRIRIGTIDELVATNPGLPVRSGFPVHVPAARAFVVIVDPSRPAFVTGIDATGDGTSLNVRVLSQRCPHLGCRPNPCLEDFWIHCPCHQSRYDRLGVKAAGELFGPAPRGMDRYPIEVDDRGVLFVDTNRVVLGPLPVALGTPGLIPPRVAGGCR